jgi:hypothetical protein
MLLALLVALSAPVPKAELPLVSWRLAKGDTFYLTYQCETLSEPVGLGMVPGAASAARLVAKLTVTAAGDKGVTLDLEVVSFATGRDAFRKEPAKLTDHPKAVGKKATLTLDRGLKVTRVESDKELATAEGGFGSGLLADYSLQSLVSDLTQALPNKRLTKGDTWEGASEYSMGEFATAALTARGTVADATADRITLAVECDRKTTGKEPVKLDSRSEKGKRTVVFDPKAGRVRKLTDEYTSEAVSGFDGREFKVMGRISSRVIISDDNPNDAK